MLFYRALLQSLTNVAIEIYKDCVVPVFIAFRNINVFISDY